MMIDSEVKKIVLEFFFTWKKKGLIFSVKLLKSYSKTVQVLFPGTVEKHVALGSFIHSRLSVNECERLFFYCMETSRFGRKNFNFYIELQQSIYKI